MVPLNEGADLDLTQVPVFLSVEEDIARLVQASTRVLANAAVGALP